jgi:hypothetical protein
VFSNYIGILLSSQGISGIYRVRPRGIILSITFLKAFSSNRIPMQSL